MKRPATLVAYGILALIAMAAVLGALLLAAFVVAKGWGWTDEWMWFWPRGSELEKSSYTYAICSASWSDVAKSIGRRSTKFPAD